MAPEMQQLSSLSNPLATLEQLSHSSSQLDGIPADLESSIRFAGARLTQAAGILLRLPQEIAAQAVIIYTRFYIGPEGGSFRIHAVRDVSAASVYMIAKISALPQTPRSILNVYAYLLSQPLYSGLAPDLASAKPDPETYYLSEGSYQSARIALLRTESILLRSLSFVTTVALPHHVALTYLQTLGVLPSNPTATSSALATRTLAYLNTALFSPQLLYLTHQPPALAVAAIYLAAKDSGVKLPGSEWWKVFDVDREDLGFLVVGLMSCEGWIQQEKEKWSSVKCPLTAEDVETEMKRRDAEAV